MTLKVTSPNIATSKSRRLCLPKETSARPARFVAMEGSDSLALAGGANHREPRLTDSLGRHQRLVRQRTHDLAIVCHLRT